MGDQRKKMRKEKATRAKATLYTTYMNADYDTLY